MTRTTANDAGPARVVVGVDGSPGSYAAMRWAVEQARLRRGLVEAIYVLEPLVPLDFTGAGFETATAGVKELEADARRALDLVVSDAAADSDVDVRKVVTEHANPGRALVRAATDAAVLVVGGHRHHGLGFLLGSTGATCMRHATCPVVIVPEDWYVSVRSQPAPLLEALP